ncbi:MAG: hypothetical protein RQ745_12285, partial [Longimicrobiales bacterium]|nr:hypothetical protein [Longimicrobiales bacterium]
MSPIEVGVRAGAHDYPVRLAHGVRGEAVDHLVEVAPGVRRWAVISDDRVGPLYGEEVARALAAAGRGGELFTFPAGEAQKTRERWAALTDA